MEKDSFVFRREWKDAISGLPDEVRLEIYEAIIEYGTTGKLPSLKPMAMLAFNFAKTTLDKDGERYRRISEKRRSAVNKRYTTSATNVECSTNATKATNVANVVPPHGDSDSELSNDNKKKPTNVGKKDAADAATLLNKRRDVFYKSLVPFVDIYGKDMVREFFDYWSEPNKSKTKIRFELERTWDLSRRLRTWASRDNRFNNGTNNNRVTSEQRAQDAASVIASLAAEEK